MDNNSLKNTKEFFLCLFILVFSLFMIINNRQIKAEITIPEINGYSTFIYYFGVILIKNSFALSLLWLSYKFKIWVIPVAFLFINTYVLALLISRLPNIYALFLVLPHGLLELPIFFQAIYTTYFGIENNIPSIKINKKYLSLYLLLIIAAFIESIITPLLSIHFLKN